MSVNFDDEIKAFALKKMKHILVNGRRSQKIDRRTSQTIRYEIDDLGYEKAVGKDETTSTTCSTTIADTPQWLLQEVAKSMQVQNAIELLQNRGFVVIDPTQENKQIESKKGISDETINTIKHELLGIPENRILPGGYDYDEFDSAFDDLDDDLD